MTIEGLKELKGELTINNLIESTLTVEHITNLHCLIDAERSICRR